MKHFFFTSNKINVNNKTRKCEISLTVFIKKNGGILVLFLNMGAAPSSGGQILHIANTVNLMNLLLMEYDVLCIVDCVDLLNLKGRTAPKKTCANRV